MQWSDVTTAPTDKALRQFAGLCLLVFGGAAVWHLLRAHGDVRTIVLGAIGSAIGLAGLVQPRAVRHIFTGWMAAAFPVGWLVSKLVLAVLFYGLFTPVAALFGVMQRDALQRRRRPQRSYFTSKIGPSDVREYFRQY